MLGLPGLGTGIPSEHSEVGWQWGVRSAVLQEELNARAGWEAQIAPPRNSSINGRPGNANSSKTSRRQDPRGLSPREGIAASGPAVFPGATQFAAPGGCARAAMKDAGTTSSR